jgi:signal transduction histidine kinase/ActR/RegA family two-component response regulator
MNASEASVLILAPIGRDGPASAELLKRVGVQTHVCKDLSELMSALSPTVGSILVAEEALFRSEAAVLSDWVARQPPWSDLPFVVLTSQLDHPGVTLWRQRLVTSLRNVSLIERPVQAITLTSAVLAAVRARSRQFELHSLLEEQERAASVLEDIVAERTKELQVANTELRTQMAERARIEESLRQAQKMEAIGLLTGGVAHDFNNLLMVITGGLEMLDRQRDPSRRQMLIDGMRQAAQRGAALTRQLLAFSRRQPLESKAVDLARRIGGMRDLLDRTLMGDSHLELQFPDGLWPVQLDPAELELAVLNLAVNARDAMPKGGTIVIRAENVQGLDRDDLKGDFVRLSVADCGTGMSPEVKEHVFEPFFTTKEVGKGSGLGLAQVYGFVTQSGGAVSIESELGRGTTVVLYVPRTLQNPALATDNVANVPAPLRVRGSAGSVLLVEDNDDVAELVSEMLDELGYEVMRAASAQAALESLSKASGIDVVFSDIMMPGDMDGVDLASKIRATKPKLPVLLTSGYSQTAGRAESEGFRVLPKPYHLPELADALDTAIRNQHAVASASNG